jgi:hypothetical protein
MTAVNSAQAKGSVTHDHRAIGFLRSTVQNSPNLRLDFNPGRQGQRAQRRDMDVALAGLLGASIGAIAVGCHYRVG